MHQVETLIIDFHTLFQTVIEIQLLRAPMLAPVTLRNLRWFGFGGTDAYLKAFLPRLTTPLLEKLQIRFFNQLSFFVTCLLLAFSLLVGLTLKCEEHRLSSKRHKEADRTRWRDLLRSFSKVESLQVPNGLVSDLSHFLGAGDGEQPLELFPELNPYSAANDSGDVKALVDARRNAGRPVIVVRH
jgi:hypothetical protein